MEASSNNAHVFLELCSTTAWKKMDEKLLTCKCLELQARSVALPEKGKKMSISTWSNVRSKLIGAGANTFIYCRVIWPGKKNGITLSLWRQKPDVSVCEGFFWLVWTGIKSVFCGLFIVKGTSFGKSFQQCEHHKWNCIYIDCLRIGTEILELSQVWKTRLPKSK